MCLINGLTVAKKAFETVKYALTHAPVLSLPDFTKPFEVICDASIEGLGAVLLQQDKPLAFESRKLIPAEINYTTGEQELLAVVHALKTWRCYLEGPMFTVITDHNPLVHLNTQPNLSRRQVRWAEYLQRFKFNWLYRPGKDNMADPLSRNPPPDQPQINFANLVLLLAMQTRSKGQKPKQPMHTVQQCLPRQGKRKRDTSFPLVSSPATRNQKNLEPLEQNTDSPQGGEELEVENATNNPSSAETVTGLPEISLHTGQEVVDILGSIRRAYKEDPKFSRESFTSKLTNKNGWWYTKDGRLAIPNLDVVKNAIMHVNHSPACVGHVGALKTKHLVERNFWWPTTGSDVRRFVQTCPQCQLNKTGNQKPGGLLTPLPIPSEPWESVSMDFITQLPKTRDGHDAIFVVVDRLTKMTHIMPTTTNVSAQGVAELYRDHVFVHHGYPQNFVSDRDTRFTSIFWQELLKCCDIKSHKSTSFHPQTDGQTERVNRVLEDMIRNYVHPQQDDWDTYLAMAEFAIKNSYHESTKSTPFRLNYGRDPKTPLSWTLKGNSKVPTVETFVQIM